MKIKILTLMVLLTCSTLIIAQEQQPLQQSDDYVDYSPLLKSKPAFKPEHNVRFSVGIAPLNYLVHETELYHTDIYYTPSPGNQYDDGLIYSNTLSLPYSFNLSYTYKPLRWLEVGATISYTGSYKQERTLFENSLGSDLHANYNSHYISVSPLVRFSWLNKEYFRMYSAISFGAGININTINNLYNETQDVETYMIPAVQVTYLGMTFGNKIYGSAELIGLGTEGFISFGIGYRF